MAYAWASGKNLAWSYKFAFPWILAGIPILCYRKRIQKFVYKGIGPVSRLNQGVVWPKP